MKNNYENTVILDGKLWYKRINGYFYLNNEKKMIWMHRYIWEKHNNKKVPEDCLLHHKDNNPHNNNIENLELMTKKEWNQKYIKSDLQRYKNNKENV